MGEPITDERLLELENNLNRGTADERQAAQAVPGLIARIRVETPKRSAYRSQPLLATLRHHWPEYLIEAAELGFFMISACFFVVLLEHPASPCAPGHSSPLPAPRVGRHGHGADRRRHYLLPSGATIGGAL